MRLIFSFLRPFGFMLQFGDQISLNLSGHLIFLTLSV